MSKMEQPFQDDSSQEEPKASKQSEQKAVNVADKNWKA